MASLIQKRNKTTLFLMALVLVFVLSAGLLRGQSNSGKHGIWHSDFRKAYDEAKRTNRPLLIHFYADWCMPCQKMEKEVLSSRELSQLVNNDFVAVKINADHHQDVVEHFSVKSLPSDVIIDPAGKVLLRNKGYLKPNVYLAGIHSASKSYQPGAPPKQEVPRQTQKPGSMPAEQRGEASSVKVGLNGFCPVSLYLNKKWERGNPDFKASFQDVVYFFTSRQARDEFQRSPEKYAPEYLGCDPVILTESGHAVPGSTKYAAYSKERLYLFLIPETRERFNRTPEKYINYRQALNIEQIEQTADAGFVRESF
ncbi:thioredoxin family protein [Polystyrenella longa]|uniref:thioredoxin family protein n=1 Tax=Polystyrenella longa TaxID=2528007 RepID=UPI0011A8256B|nr:thioredoxin family protein [Polystyrenella longa]